MAFDWTSLIGTAVDAGTAIAQNRRSKDMIDIEKQNLAFQQESFDQSYQHQRDLFEHQLEAYEYQKGLQEKIFQREDNSIQRRVADLRAAGLSGVLAAGQGARAGAVSPIRPAQNAPQKQAPQMGTAGLAASIQAIGQFAGRKNICRD